MVLVMTLSGASISRLHALYAFLLTCPILFGSVLIHEIGHAAMAVRYGGDVQLILLWPLGGVAYISLFGSRNPIADAVIAIAGPLTHIPQVIIWIGFLALSRGTLQRSDLLHISLPLTWSTLWIHLCSGAITIQFILFFFNLLPAFPLDGGRLFASFLVLGNVEEIRVNKICAIVGGAVGSFIFLQSLFNIILSQNSLFFGWSSLLIAAFIIAHSWQLWNSSESSKPMGYTEE